MSMLRLGRRRARTCLMVIVSLIALAILLHYDGRNLLGRSKNVWPPRFMVDVTQLEIVSHNKSICELNGSNRSSKLCVVFVVSARQNAIYRRIIRQTWGSIKRAYDWEFRKVFIIGSDPDGLLDGSLADESRMYGDMVIGDFVDSYRNLSVKHVFGLNWVHKFCRNAAFVVKADDDVFINPYSLVRFWQHKFDHLKLKAEIHRKLICYGPNPTAPILRPGNSMNEKWSLTFEEYPEDYFPPYCAGAAYITTTLIIKKVLSIHSQSNFVRLEDLFATGILPRDYNRNSIKKNSIGLEYIREIFDIFNYPPKWSTGKIFYLMKELLTPNMNFKGMHAFWQMTQQSSRGEFMTSRCRDGVGSFTNYSSEVNRYVKR